jgi:hypothetical protein
VPSFLDILRNIQSKARAAKANLRKLRVIPFPSTPPIEVIQRIFTFSNQTTLAIGLRVSRSCFDICGPLLYYEIDARPEGRIKPGDPFKGYNVDNDALPLISDRAFRRAPRDVPPAVTVNLKCRLLAYTRRLVFYNHLCITDSPSGSARTCKDPRPLPSLETIILLGSLSDCECNDWLRAKTIVLHRPSRPLQRVLGFVMVPNSNVRIPAGSNITIHMPWDVEHWLSSALSTIENLTLIYGGHGYDGRPKSQADIRDEIVWLSDPKEIIRSLTYILRKGSVHIRLVNIRESLVKFTPCKICRYSQQEWEMRVHAEIDLNFSDPKAREEAKERLVFLTMEEYLAEGGHEDVMGADAVERFREEASAQKRGEADPYYNTLPIA